MNRRFNVTGLCAAEEDYMVDISGKIAQIRELVDRKCYFTINRARQYGKTTTLSMLHKNLADEYIVARISFEGVGDESFSTPEMFCQMFLELISHSFESAAASEKYCESWFDNNVTDFNKLKRHLSKMCKDKKVVLIIDEVDKNCSNRIFVNFLSVLRDKFLARKDGMGYTFHSVILAGVYDIKNIKEIMTSEDKHAPLSAAEKKQGSPWNIAVNFTIDMSFNPAEIATMLEQYEADYHTGMDITAIAAEIHNYTSGYPFLTSRICQCIDEELNSEWTLEGVRNAVKILLGEKNTLFDDLTKNLENNKELYSLLKTMLYTDEFIPAGARTPEVELGLTFGILCKKDGRLRINNIIFETIIYDYIADKNLSEIRGKTGTYNSIFITEAQLDMPLVLRKFSEFMYGEYRDSDLKFIEQNGRLLFLSFLKPIVNGSGFVFVEPQTRMNMKMDMVVVYGNMQYILELKIWHGESKHQEAYEQLLRYLDSKGADTGYLLTFDLRKNANKNPRAEWVTIGDKKIFDVVT